MPLECAFKVTGLVVPDLVEDTSRWLLERGPRRIFTLQLRGNKQKYNIVVPIAMKDKHTQAHLNITSSVTVYTCMRVHRHRLCDVYVCGYITICDVLFCGLE